MARFILLIILGIISWQPAAAQDARKFWSDGDLMWSDFQEKAATGGASYLAYFLGYNTTKEKINDTNVVRIEAFCYVDRLVSWVDPKYKSDALLAYNQVIFDIVELHRRALQYRLHRVQDVSEAEYVMRHVLSQCNEQVVSFQMESESGANTQMVERWKHLVEIKLEASPYERIPAFEERNFGIGMHGGLSGGTFTGTLGNHFSPYLGILYGFDFAFKKHLLLLNGNMAWNTLRKDFFSADQRFTGEGAKVAILEAAYGYAALDKADFRLTPFAGLGIVEVSKMSEDGEEELFGLVDYNFLLGLSLDYKLATRLTLFPHPYVGIREAVETVIRTRFFVAPVTYSTSMKGYSINLSVSIGGFSRLIRLENHPSPSPVFSSFAN